MTHGKRGVVKLLIQHSDSFNVSITEHKATNVALLIYFKQYTTLIQRNMPYKVRGTRCPRP